MPTGPKGEKRPADVIGNAVKVMRIATGEETEDLAPDDGKDPAAKALGKKGGAARDHSGFRFMITRPTGFGCANDTSCDTCVFICPFL